MLNVGTIIYKLTMLSVDFFARAVRQELKEHVLNVPSILVVWLL